MFLKYYLALSLLSLLSNSRHAAAHKITQTENPASDQSHDNIGDEKDFSKYIQKLEQKIIETITNNFNTQNENIEQKLAKITALEYDIKNKMAVVIDSSCKYKNISESNDAVNGKLADLQSDMQTLERTLAAQGNTLEAIHSLFYLENETETTIYKKRDESLHNNNQDSQNSTEKIPTSVSETTTESRAERSLCGVPVPSWALAGRDVWQEYKAPAQDQLDVFLVNSTGCELAALAHVGELATATPQAGARGDFTWRVFVRSRGLVVLHVRGTVTTNFLDVDMEQHKYTFTIAENDNDVSKFSDNDYLWQVRSTPDVLSADRYVPLTVRLQNETLTLSVECDGEPLFSHNLDVLGFESASLDYIRLRAWSKFGAKFLHKCPVAPPRR